MRRVRASAVGAVAAVLLSSLASAGEKTGTEMLFDTASLDGIGVGKALRYSHVRSADENIPTREIEDGSITIAPFEKDEKTKLRVTLHEDAAKRVLEHLPADRGNPIFIVFLESSVSSVKFATKGSPFYIRNRFKDAFATGGDVTEIKIQFDGETIPATEVTYMPFKGDKNRIRIGEAFENLEVRFVLSEKVPGRFVSLTSEATVDGTQYFVEDVRLISLEATQ